MPSQEFLNRRGSIWERTDFAGRPFPELRREMDARVMEELQVPESVEVHEGTVAGVPGRWANTNRGTGRFLLYIHGGGFTLGSSGVALPYVTELARRFGADSFSPDYRLAPEYRFPTNIEDCWNVYTALLADGWKPENIIWSGESAGATICLALLHLCKERGVPYPKAVIPLSPVTDAVGQSENDEAVIEGLDSGDAIWNMYCPGQDLRDVRISPANGDLSGFPPVFLLAGGAEALMIDSLIFTKNAAKQGVDVQLKIGKDMIHTYPLDFLDYPEAREAFEEISLFCAAQWGA